MSLLCIPSDVPDTVDYCFCEALPKIRKAMLKWSEFEIVHIAAVNTSEHGLGPKWCESHLLKCDLHLGKYT